MCGIAGIINKQKNGNNYRQIQKIVSFLRHRGPDDVGVWDNGRLSFGMRRLSIIGHKCGKQPMWYKKKVAIVFNGEIYNYQKLHNEIKLNSNPDSFQSDTSVILRGYIKYGLKFVSKLNGMFSIAIFDFVKNKAFLIRDRYGVKPLYYYKDNNKFIFASEIKAIVKTFPALKKINTQAINDYLSYRFIPGPNTIWKEIKSLPESSVLELNLKTLKINIFKYYKIKWQTKHKKNKTAYQEEFNSLFLNSVKLRLEAADVPLGVLLSGGLDSSSIVAAARELGHKDINTFSISFTNSKNADESKFATDIAKKFKTNHIAIKLSVPDFLKKIREVVYCLDQPLADLASIPLFFICAEAKKHVKVLLSGEGADEVLAGYNIEKIALHAETINKFKIYKYIPKKLKRKSLTKFFDPVEYFKNAEPYSTKGFSENEKLNLWKQSYRPFKSASFVKNFYKKLSYKNFINRIQASLFKQWLIEDLLMKMDKISMHHSLEVREPFLDFRLVDMAANIPQSIKFGNWPFYKSKNLLRKFASDKLPKCIVDRKKMGFPTPANEWLENKLKNQIFEELTNSSCKIQKYFNLNEIKAIFNFPGKIKEENFQKIWNLFFLEKWMKIWC